MQSPGAHGGGATPGRFLVLVAVENFEALTHLIGPEAAQGLIAGVAEDVKRFWGGHVDVRAGRNEVEVVASCASADAFRTELANLIGSLRKDLDFDGYVFTRRAIVGAVEMDDRGSLTDAYGTARLALVQAQGAQEPVILPHASARSASVDQLTLMRDLQRAVRHDGLELHYQPKLRARTGEVAAAEGLVRWTCPEAGPVAPDLFIPIAEATGDIRLLTQWVISRAIRDLNMLAQADAPLRVDINMSGTLLSDRHFVREVIDQLEPAGGMVGIELTETAVIADPDRALANLRLYAEAGIRVAIDDYGAGFSSLAYLQQLPVSELKIDKSFILRLTSQHRDPLLVRSTIDLAHALEVDVTAEGVDNPQVLALLRVMGCDLVQGFHLCPPLPLEKLIGYLADKAGQARAPDNGIERLRQRVDALRKRTSTR